MGPSYDGFLTTVSSCLLTASILLACYLLSAKSIGLLRSSLFVSTRLRVEKTRFWPVKDLADLAAGPTLYVSCLVCLVRQSAVAIADKWLAPGLPHGNFTGKK
jgi:hypothetical protein